MLFWVKSNDTESGAAAIKPHVAPDAVVLSMQNGVENADRLRALLPQEVAGAVVYIGTEMAARGMSGIMAAANWSSSRRRPAMTSRAR